MPNNELNKLTQYVQRYSLPTRRASDVNNDAPDRTSAYDAARIMRKDIKSVYNPLESYFSKKYNPDETNDLLKSYASEAQSPRKETIPVVVFDRKTDKALEADDYLVVDENDSAESTINRTKNRYGIKSVPGILCDMIESYAETKDLSLHDSTRLVVGNVEKDFPQLYEYSQIYTEKGSSPTEASRLALDKYAKELKNSVPSDANKTRRGALTEEASLSLSKKDTEGLAQIYSVQRRVYSKSELAGVNMMLNNNPKLRISLLVYQSMLVNFTKDYLKQYPERADQTLEHFESIFITNFDENQKVSIAPNLRFLSTFANNILGGVVKVAGEKAEKNVSDFSTLSSNDIAEGVQLALSLGVFKMYVPKFNQSENSKYISWNGNLQQVCPADRMIAQSASTMLPKIYESLIEKV